jgi:hypothetical protein
MSSLCFGSLEACPAVVGGVQTVVSALYGPNGEAIRGKDRAGLCGERHELVVI